MRANPAEMSPDQTDTATGAFRSDRPRRVAFTLPNRPATDALARWLAPRLGAGDTILLEGPVGAGKSHFARALIAARLQAAGLPREDVPSPTFTLVQCYDAGAVEIWHADLYRLTGPDEVLELGLEEAFATAICLVEWPGRLAASCPASALTVTLLPVPDPDARDARLQATSPRWDALLADAATNFGANAADD